MFIVSGWVDLHGRLRVDMHSKFRRITYGLVFIAQVMPQLDMNTLKVGAPPGHTQTVLMLTARPPLLLLLSFLQLNNQPLTTTQHVWLGCLLTKSRRHRNGQYSSKLLEWAVFSQQLGQPGSPSPGE